MCLPGPLLLGYPFEAQLEESLSVKRLSGLVFHSYCTGVRSQGINARARGGGDKDRVTEREGQGDRASARKQPREG